MLADIGVAVLTAVLLSLAFFSGDAGQVWDTVLPDAWAGLGMYVAIWVLILRAHGLYSVRARWSIANDIRAVLNATAWLGLITFAFLYFARFPDVSRGFMVALLATQFGVTVASRAVLRWMFHWLRRHGRNRRHVVVLGTGPVGRAFAAKLEGHPELGLQVEGFLGEPDPELPQRWPLLGGIDDLPAVIHDRVVDEVAICLVSEEWHLIESVAQLCEAEGRVARMPVMMPNLRIATGHVDDLDGTPVLSLLTGPKEALGLAVKRLTDVVVSTVGLVALVPLFALIGTIVLITQGSPIFFRQERVGLNGRRFHVLKFRTMVRDAEARRLDLLAHNEIRGHAFKVTADPRITPFGNWLRRSSLDELPQLWNVLRGEMSLVGPRPPLPQEVAEYDPWHRRRLSMKPGITGLWQIEGRREPEFDRWVEKDLEYIDRWSPWLDLQIMLRTIPAVIRAQGR